MTDITQAKDRNALSRRAWMIGACAVAAAALIAPVAGFAAEDDSDSVAGELVLKTPFEFIRFSVDGKSEWDNHEYADKRKTLIILGLDRSEDHTIVLTPRQDGWEPLTITVTGADYKRTMVRKGKAKTAVFRAAKTVKFEKTNAPAKPTGDAGN